MISLDELIEKLQEIKNIENIGNPAVNLQVEQEVFEIEDVEYNTELEEVMIKDCHD